LLFNLILIRKIFFIFKIFSNSFGLIPSSQFNPGTIFPNQTISTTLDCSTNGPVQKMEPLSNLQVAIKNNIGKIWNK